MAPRKSAKAAPQAAQDPADTPAPAVDDKKEAPTQAVKPIGGLVYVLRQYTGFVLGILSIFLTWYTHDQDSPYMMLRLWGCVLVGTVGAIVHEIRPYKRIGYGDVAWDQLFDSRFWKSITGRTEETHDFMGPRAVRRKAA